jgi:tetratricopeptide (TPR) repeat protein
LTRTPIDNRRGFTSLLALATCLCLPGTARCATDEVSQPPADRLLDGGHYLRAEPLIRAALARNPNDAHALSNLSVVDWAFNRLDTSIADAEKAVAAAPGSAEAHSKLADALGAKLASSNAGTMTKISLAHRFRKEIDRTLELDANDIDALQDLARFYWHAPGMVGGDKSKAKQTADRLFPISPYRGAATRADFASDDSDINRRNSAVRAIWQTAVAARSESYDARAALAAAYLEETADANHLASAEAEAKRALALDPTRISAYTVLALVYTSAGRWNDADAVLKQARERVPDDLTPRYRIAVAILAGNQNQQLQRAEQMLRDYLTQPPEGQQPSHADAHWRLGQVLERQGRKADAIREFQTAIQQDGSLEEARKDLKRLS